MLPYKQEKGSEAFKKVMCYVGMPPEFEGKDTVTFEKANVKKVPSLKYVTIQDICKELGGKV
jgi:large subunit ribosomal protein L13